MSVLKDIREKNGLSQTELAAKAGVSTRHIAFIETGERKPSIDLAFKLADILGTSVEQIFLPNECTKST